MYKAIFVPFSINSMSHYNVLVNITNKMKLINTQFYRFHMLYAIKEKLINNKFY